MGLMRNGEMGIFSTFPQPRKPQEYGPFAAALHVSAGYLSRHYKQKTGENILDAIVRRKIEHAKNA